MNVERLQHLIETLREVQSRDAAQGHSHFNMGNWIDHAKAVDGKLLVTCETVACAGGWEASTKYAQERGLYLDTNGDICMWDNQVGLRLYNEEALQQYFDVPGFITTSIFFGSSYTMVRNGYENVKPQNVMDRVTYLIEVGVDEYRTAVEKHWNYRLLPGGDGGNEDTQP